MHKSILLLLSRPTCIAHAIAILLHGYCALYNPCPTTRVYAIYYTILGMEILSTGRT